MAPLKTRSMTDGRQQVRERAPPNREGKFIVDNKPNNRHHKMCRQFTDPRNIPRVSVREITLDSVL